MYIYFSLVEPVLDLVFFFARSPNRFSSRKASHLHLPSPTTSSTLRLFPRSTLRLSLSLPSISPRFISSRNARACNLLLASPHPTSIYIRLLPSTQIGTSSLDPDLASSSYQVRSSLILPSSYTDAQIYRAAAAVAVLEAGRPLRYGRRSPAQCSAAAATTHTPARRHVGRCCPWLAAGPLPRVPCFQPAPDPRPTPAEQPPRARPRSTVAYNRVEPWPRPSESSNPSTNCRRSSVSKRARNRAPPCVVLVVCRLAHSGYALASRCLDPLAACLSHGRHSRCCTQPWRASACTLLAAPLLTQPGRRQ
jgi:hypothetical protein